MKPANFRIRPLAVLVASACACVPAYAAPVRAASPVSASPCEHAEIGSIVKLEVGKAILLRSNVLKSPVTRVLLGNPENSSAEKPIENDKKKGEKVTLNLGSADNAQQQSRRPGAADVDVLLLGCVDNQTQASQMTAAAMATKEANRSASLS